MTISSSSQKRLVLVDHESVDALPCAVKAHWSSREVPVGCLSLPLAVEDNAKELVRDYVSWCHDLGLEKCGDKSSLREKLKLFPHLSFWWLTLIAEKSSVKSPAIYRVFKIRVLEKLYLKENCTELVYQGTDHELALVLSEWCRSMGHVFSHQTPSENQTSVPKTKTSIWKRAPGFVQVLAYVAKRYFTRLRHVKFFKSHDSIGSAQFNIVSYFPNIDLDKAKAGTFRSRYWEKLHDELDNLKGKINWILFYTPSAQMSYSEMIKMRDAFREKSGGHQEFFLVEEFFSFKDLLKAFLLYFKIRLVAKGLRNYKKYFCFQNSNLNFFKFLKPDWDKSFCSYQGFDSILHAVIFDNVAKTLKSENLLYIWENQPWELALTASYREYQKGRVLAYQHAALSPLDLRPYVDARAFFESGFDVYPAADVYAVNGTAAQKLMIESGYPESKLCLVEAIRYANMSTKKQHSFSQDKILLIVTGYAKEDALYQLGLVQQAKRAGLLASYNKIWIKPHPFLPVEGILKSFAEPFEHEIKTEALPKLWHQVNRVFVANWSSTGIESLYAGLPTAVCSPSDEMNLTPLFGYPGVLVVSNLAKLSEFLAADQFVQNQTIDYFNLDQGTIRWKALLEKTSLSA